MGEFDIFSQELMLDFLQKYFPVKRIRSGRRFKRGITIDSGFYSKPPKYLFLSPQSELNQLLIILTKVLEDVFGFPSLEVKLALVSYLKLS